MQRFQTEIEKLNDFIASYARSNLDLLNNAIEDLVRGGGKKLRPIMVLLSARTGAYEEEKMLEIASGVEFLHMATLVHDDIIDEARLRRGNVTAQEKFGKDIAVFVGDFLLSKSYSIFSHNLSRSSMNRLSKIVRLICEGEIKQYQEKYDTGVSFYDYLRRIRRKTALLFGASTYLGAYESGLRGLPLYHFYKMGLDLGMAFQIQDDLLDFTGKEQKTGKGVGKDMITGIYTLPLIYAFSDERHSNRVKEILMSNDLTEDRIEEINELIITGGYLKKSRDLGQRYLDRAESHLVELPEGSYREDLQYIIDRQLKREK